MKTVRFSTKVVGAILSGVATCAMALAGLVAAPASTVYAASPAQTPVPPTQFDGKFLEFILKRELLVLQGQQDRITLSREMAALAQTWIDDQKAKGKDTSSLEAALAVYNTQLDAAQASWNTAKGILDAKAGFDADGHVTDRAQARETVRRAGNAMRETHHILREAGYNFREAVREYRQANAPSA